MGMRFDMNGVAVYVNVKRSLPDAPIEDAQAWLFVVRVINSEVQN